MSQNMNISVCCLQAALNMRESLPYACLSSYAYLGCVLPLLRALCSGSESLPVLNLCRADSVTCMLGCAETLTFAADLKDEGFTVISYCPGW